ncbi:MAG: FAD:protein FMN transferase [Firmicutes bacterium]|nr:FAD:protein FMN transferase [Bacillota bacterium]
MAKRLHENGLTVYTFQAMGCACCLTLTAPADRLRQRRLLRDAQHITEEVNQVASRFNPKSELSILNREGHARVSSTLFALLEAAIDAARKTGGWVDLTVLPALLAVGYDRDFEYLQKEGSKPSTGVISWRSTWREIQLDQRTRNVSLPPETQVDLGGIAKEWAADQAGTALSAAGGAGWIDLGGDLRFFGVLEPQSVAVDDPLEMNGILAQIVLKEGGVATSGVTKRRWKHGDKIAHHLIDPWTGKPTESNLLQVTCVAPTTLQAGTWAKAALLQGEERLDEIAKNAGIAGIAVDRSGRRIPFGYEQ